MDQTCPTRKKTSPATAARCDCGWDFVTGQPPAGLAEADAAKYANFARSGWLFPTLAWVSQIALTLAFHGASGLAGVWLIAMVLQFGLIIAGLHCSLQAVKVGRAFLSRGQMAQAILGIVISGGTILLIVGLTIISCF